MNSVFEILNDAKKTMFKNDDMGVYHLYERASEMDIPYYIISMHRSTKGYMVMEMCNFSFSFFTDLFQVKSIAEKDEKYRLEYMTILKMLINFREMFLREIALNYFCHVSVISNGSDLGKNLDKLIHYLENNINDITINDCYDIKKYYPNTDLTKLKYDLERVIAYSYNLLLMYVCEKKSYYMGQKNYAESTISDNKITTEYKTENIWSDHATVLPRLELINKGKYYNQYLEKFNAICDRLNICSEQELLQDVSRLVYRSKPKNSEEKEFFKYEKVFEKEDLERDSLFSFYNKLVFFYLPHTDPVSRFFIGKNQVNSFELDNPFNRKKIKGVCNMIAWAYDCSIEFVRTVAIILGCLGIGVVAYLVLMFLMKNDNYLKNLRVVKHY